MLKITLVKSIIGAVPKNTRTAHALGIRKIGQSTLNHDNPAIRGMIHQIKHLLKVEEVEEQPIVRKRRDPKGVAEAKAAKANAPVKAKRVAKAVKATDEPVVKKTRSTKTKKSEE